MADRLLTVAEVAELVSAHPKTVLRWIHEGRLPARSLGGRKLGWRIREGDLNAFINGDAPAAEGKGKAAA